jgi:phage gp36-like protein
MPYANQADLENLYGKDLVVALADLNDDDEPEQSVIDDAFGIVHH